MKTVSDFEETFRGIRTPKGREHLHFVDRKHYDGPPRYVVSPPCNPRTVAAFMNARIATSDLFHDERHGAELYAESYSRAVRAGVVFG